jgi:hypothetical protein
MRLTAFKYAPNSKKQSASDPLWISFIVLRLIVSEVAGNSAALRPETGNTAARTQWCVIKPGRVPSRLIKVKTSQFERVTLYRYQRREGRVSVRYSDGSITNLPKRSRNGPRCLSETRTSAITFSSPSERSRTSAIWYSFAINAPSATGTRTDRISSCRAMKLSTRALR